MTAGIAPQSSDNEPLLRATYGAASIAVTPAATPGLIWQMVGAAGKVIRVKNLTITGSGASAAGTMPVALKRYSSAATGGTPVAVVPTKHDTTNPTSLATISHYTANPTAGTLVGTIHGGALGFPTGGQNLPVNWAMTWLNDQAIVLRGATDVIGLDLLGAAVPTGGLFTVDIEYTEETAGNSFDVTTTT